MKTQDSLSKVYDHFISQRPEGMYTIAGENYMVMDEEFIDDLVDMGYCDIELEDLIVEYYDWLEDVTE